MPLPAPAHLGCSLADVDTPALILELDAFERNIARMADRLRGTGVRFRPHAKNHKCSEIARRQMAAGAVGVCCQKVSEAEALAAGGVTDVLISNEIVGDAKLDRVCALARTIKLAICVDAADNVVALDAAAARIGVRLDTLVEVNVGGNRCGVEPGEPAAILAERVAASRHLRFAGLQAYQGSVQHKRTVPERRDAMARATERVRVTREMIVARGLACDTVTGAGTGTFPFELASGVWDEIQAGSYIFMDRDYSRNDFDASWPAFEQSLFVLTTVMSAPNAERVVVDAGTKASAFDSGMPGVWQRSGVEYVNESDEHGVLAVASGAIAPALGEKILLVPGHCDPTVNLHDWFVCVRHGVVEALWPVTARGMIW